jgi:DNA repair protein SbcD/Mre11
MIKILHTADWHLGKRLQEFSRLEEQKLVLEEIIDIADQYGIDLVLLAGDIFDSFNPSHEAIELFYKTLKRLSKNGLRPIIAISGNHDSTMFVEAPDPLARELGIIFYSRYDSVVPEGKLDTGMEILRSDQGFIEFTLPGSSIPVRMILAPYANEVLLKTYLGETDKEAEFRNIMASKWNSLAEKYCDSSGVNLMIGHFFFMKEGSIPDKEPESERPILHIGGTQALLTKSIPKQLQYVALGHLHRYHSVDMIPCPIVYSSSPLAYSFSEAEQKKQVVIVEVDPAKPVSITPIELKEGKPLYKKKFDKLSDALEWLEENPYCFVEITFETEHSIDANTRRAILKAHDGIVNLIPNIKNPFGMENSGIKAEDLGKDMVALFKMYYQNEKGQEPNSDLIEILKEVISQNEET